MTEMMPSGTELHLLDHYGTFIRYLSSRSGAVLVAQTAIRFLTLPSTNSHQVLIM